MKTFWKFSVVSLILGLASYVGMAQNNNAPWTLERCLEHGLLNSIRIRQGQLDVQGSEITVKNAQMQRLPSVNANSSVGTNLGRTIDPTTNEFTFNSLVSQSISASANVTLFSGFSINNTIAQSKIDRQASEYSLEDTKNQVSLDIINFFTQVLFNREQLEAAQARLETSEAQLAQTKKQVELGVFPVANELQAQQQVATDELQVVNFENAVALSLLQLRQLLMVNPNDPFDIVSPELEAPGSYLIDQGAQAIYEDAVKYQPSIKAVDAQVESAGYGVEIAKGGRYPSLSAGISWRTNYSSLLDSVPTEETVLTVVPIGFVDGTNELVVTPRNLPAGLEPISYFGQWDYNSTNNVGVTLSIPIFNNYRVQTQIDRSKIALERAEVNAINTRNTLRQNIEQAYQNVVAAQKTYQANQNSVSAQRELFANIEQRYNLGAANAVEFTQGKNNLATAESDLIRAKYDYIFKIKVLEFYQNKPLTFD
ncbi:MAG TPA: TolC family protein [Cytophagales bacterium]|nr:TolC family protein [Cytophagales bacterium]HAA18034.1 TolC family protein [Cytophagales bacterium]HAP63058.1 TolC family protein [Cytophagales bacterium]